MSVATASAVFGLRLTRTISRALPRMTAAIAQAQPTLPVPTIPIFMDVSVCHAVDPPAAARARPRRRLTRARRGSPQTGTRCAAQPRRSSSRSGWRWPRRCARRKPRGFRAKPPPDRWTEPARERAYKRLYARIDGLEDTINYLYNRIDGLERHLEDTIGHFHNISSPPAACCRRAAPPACRAA